MKLRFLVSDQTNPYWNIAVENYLLAQEEYEAITLYLWRNRRTVVIGQNQNPYAECNVDQLLADGGYLMRRRTGGGAVYHDDGNLNFSFIVPKGIYDQARQFEVLRQAVADYGISSEVSGRNDVLANGRKFSGNAFSRSHWQNLHHGTILIKSNLSDLQRYLRPNPAKMHKHGVSSVQSRVVNLSELCPDITSEGIVPHLHAAFEHVYGGVAEEISFDELLQQEGVKSLYESFASEEWIYSRWRSFKATRTANYDWGLVELQLIIDEAEGCIAEVGIASDGLDPDAIAEAQRLLQGAKTACPPSSQNPIVQDIITLAYS